MFNPAEYPWGLISVAAAAAAILAVYKSLRPQKNCLKYWIIPLMLVFCGFAVDILIKTDTEKIKCTISMALKAAAEENAEEIGRLLAENYSDSGHSTRSKMMAYCRVMLADPVIYKNYKSILSTDITGNDAKVLMTVRVVFDDEGIVYEAFEKKIMFVKAEVHLIKQSDSSWLINRAELLEIDRHPADWGQIRQALDF